MDNDCHHQSEGGWGVLVARTVHAHHYEGRDSHPNITSNIPF